MNQKNKTYKPFVLGGMEFMAEDCIDGVLINPELPINFDNTANEMRPLSHKKFVGRPYIQTYSASDFDPADHTDEYADMRRKAWAEGGRNTFINEWFAAWPSGIRHDVRCLDVGAWDRLTHRGQFATMDEAISRAKSSTLFGSWGWAR